MFTSTLFRCAAGVLAGFALFEVGLRPFVAGWNQPEGPVRTIRSYEEGLSVAHFEPDGLCTYGNRLTGHPPLPGAPEGLIVGDSHVIAQAVLDDETMGAVIEGLSRAAGRPLNVRQYGWSSAKASTYLGSAELLLRSRNPTWVAVVINSFFSVHALSVSRNWRMELGPGDSYRLIDLRPSPTIGRFQQMRQQIGRSALALAIWRRIGMMWNVAASEDSLAESARVEEQDPRLAEATARVPRVTILGLQRAYGSRLIIVYTPSFFGADYDTAEPVEQEVLNLCAEYGVACISTREAMQRERYHHLLLSRGFHNTAPGAGHFNATGHRIIGDEIWHYVATKFPPPR